MQAAWLNQQLTRAGDPFHIPLWLDQLGGSVSQYPRAWIRLGNLETRLLAEQIEGRPIDRPIYISGLARSGTTILLETLARHPDTASHAYKDYPAVFTPISGTGFWNALKDAGVPPSSAP